MASGFVTSAGKQWAGMYDCGQGSYAKPASAPKPTVKGSTGKSGKK